MLNMMRNTLKYSKWILMIIVLSFVLFWGVDWWETGQTRGPDQWIARVNGGDIDIERWQNRVRALDSQYRRMFGGQYDQLRGSLRLAQNAAEQEIDAILIARDAERLGLAVTDDELSAAITAIPAFQKDGRFVGADTYQQMFKQGLIPGITSAEQFEASLREDMLVGKWESVIAASLAVSDEDVQREFRRRYEKATLEYIAAPIDQSIPETKPSDAELETWYQANIDRFGKGEGRRLFYVLFDDAEVGERVQVSDAEIEEYYRSNSQQFERPERRRARHILIKVAPDADQAATDAARVKAEDLARQARGGADFGQLAAKFSDDPGSKDKGGDVGIFPRGQMVPEFEDVAFTLNAGVVSDPVKSQYGFHVIRVEEIQPGGAQPLAEVREQIKSQLRFPRLREAAGKLAQEFRTKAGDGAKFRPAADEMKLTVRDGGVVLRGDSIPGVGPAPALLAAAFALPKGGVSDELESARGAVVLTVQEIIPDYVPPLATRVDRVLATYRRERGQQAVKNSLTAALARSRGELEPAAKELKLEVTRTEPPFARGGSLGIAGADPALDAAAFDTPVGANSPIVVTPQAVVVARVLSREQADMTGLERERAAIRGALRQTLAQRLVDEKRDALRKAAKVELNVALLDQLG